MELRAPGRALSVWTAVIAALIALLMGFGAPSAGAQEITLTQPATTGTAPEGYELSAREAIAIADRTEAVRAERRERQGVRTTAYTNGPRRWQVSYHVGDEEVAQVQVDDPSRSVLEAWRGIQVAWPMARGYEGAFGRGLNAPWIWLPLCALFLLPFVDPRRPFRLLHLDLLVLLGFGVSHVFFNRGEISASVPLAYPVLLYLLARMLLAGFRPRPRPAQALVPLLPIGAVALAIVFLVGFRVALNVVDSNVIDVGYAGVIGADRIADGRELYDGGFPRDNTHGDTYGPVNYLTYLPWEQLLPLRGGAADPLRAAHAAALTFDLLTLGGLLLLGRRLRPGEEGRRLGIALGYAWASYPYALYALASNANDSLVALLMVASLLAIASPAGRGALLAVAGAAKFAPLLLAPLLVAGLGEDRRRVRAMAVSSVALVTVLGLLFVPWVPESVRGRPVGFADGLAQLWERTLWSQLDRESPFSVWGQWPVLRPLQVVVQVATVGLALVVAWLPRRRTTGQVAALGAALLVALQIATTHWFYLYIVWWAPLALVALFTAYGTAAPEREPSAQERDREPVLA